MSTSETQYLDRIAAALKEWGHYEPGWSLKCNPLATHLDAVSKDPFDTPAEAFAEAQRFAASLVDEHVTLANRVEIGVASNPLEWWDGDRWRATLSVVLLERQRLEDDSALREIRLS